MNYLRCVLAGMAAAIIAIVIWMAAGLAFINWRIEPPPDGVVAFVLTPGQILLAAGIGFAIGFWRNVRKQRRRVRV